MTVLDIDIFISHSSQDLSIVEGLVSLLKNSMPLNPSKIRCTSLDGHRLQAGAKTSETLKKEILKSKVFLGLISASSLNSQFVMFELGARWGSDKPIIPIVIKSSEIELLSEPLKGINILSLESESQVFQLIEDICEHLKYEKYNTSHYAKFVSDLSHISKGSKVKNSLKPNFSTDGYVLFDGGIIKDETTGIFWYIGGDINMNWISSKEWTERLTAFESKWRMPTIDELKTLYNPNYTAGLGYYKNGKHWPAKIHPVFEAIGSGSWVWSSEKINKTTAKAFNFNQNEEIIFPITNTKYSTRAFAIKK